MYRFLATPRWVSLALLAVLLAWVMVGLGLWQFDRYHERSAINARIDAGARAEPVPAGQLLPAPALGGGRPPAPHVAYSRVTVTGVYDRDREILARGRTVDGRVGYEVLTPLRQADGSAIVVDRGWIPPARQGANVPPEVPPPPSGEVTVVGSVRLSESGGRPVEHYPTGREVRRINLQAIGAELPYPIYGAYVQLDTQTPAADPQLVRVAPRHENALQNAAYAVQWWLMAGLTLFGYGYLARREAQALAGFDARVRDLADAHDDARPVSPAV